MRKHKQRIQLSLLICIILILPFISVATVSAQQDESTDFVERAKSLMDDTERIRGLEFLYDLPVDLVSQEEIAEIIDRQLSDELSDELDHAYSALYVMLGLMPRGSSILEDYQVLAEEQVAGLYDPHEKRFYIVDIDISDMLSSALDDLGGWGSFLSGFMESLIDEETQEIMTNTIIVHELTHALDDQHFDIEGTMNELHDANSDDAQLAYMSLLEGNATRVMNSYALGGMDTGDSLFGDLMNMDFAEMILDYNPFLERIMLTPYMQGEIFVNNILSREGQAGLDRVFADPPQSMEQVLHPEKFLPTRDMPSHVDAPDLSAALPGWELEATDTLGELITGLVFEMQTGNRAMGENIAMGWDYDIVTTWRSPGDDLAMAWITVWDSNSEAGEFFDEYCHLLEIKHPGGSWAVSELDYAIYTGMGLAAIMQREGRTVVLVEGVPGDKAEMCLNAAWPDDVTYR